MTKKEIYGKLELEIKVFMFDNNVNHGYDNVRTFINSKGEFIILKIDPEYKSGVFSVNTKNVSRNGRKCNFDISIPYGGNDIQKVVSTFKSWFFKNIY